MRIDIISAVPDLLHSPFEHSILKRASKEGLIQINIHKLHDYSTYSNHQIDDYQYGGGAGMVLMIDPIVNCIESIKTESIPDEIIYMSPDGVLLDQKICNTYSLKNHIIILAGHYKGIDERIREHVITQEISIGSYVLTGGELPAAVLVDSICRLIPGVMNNETSALTDSFQDQLLAPPVYTRPEDYNGWKVPPVLLSGHFKKIEDWRHEQAVLRTKLRRPDLLDNEQ